MRRACCVRYLFFYYIYYFLLIIIILLNSISSSKNTETHSSCLLYINSPRWALFFGIGKSNCHILSIEEDVVCQLKGATGVQNTIEIP